ncbi:unnamed protein product [marine sediment metagenome]|uniref:Uncharacterized protein n=1 Tax=marine sediment metagenome TaxID=412755 RepID=X0TV15_9ZZZZ
MAAYNIGRNVKVEKKANTLTITIDLTAEGKLSASGKSDTIATTGAPQGIGELPDGRPVKMNLSVFAPAAA